MPEIERLFGNVEAVKHLADEIREGFSGSISIATVATLSATLVATTIKRFHKQYPRVRFDIKALSTRHAIDSVANNQIDVGILDVPATGVDLEVKELCRAEVGCVMRADHPLAKRKALTPKDIAADADLVCRGHARRVGPARGLPCGRTAESHHLYRQPHVVGVCAGRSGRGAGRRRCVSDALGLTSEPGDPPLPPRDRNAAAGGVFEDAAGIADHAQVRRRDHDGDGGSDRRFAFDAEAGIRPSRTVDSFGTP